jgi:hypothetical protein
MRSRSSRTTIMPRSAVRPSVYRFNVSGIGPSSKTFTDPTIAVGYNMRQRAGGPNFASVILPDVGGGVFDLSYLSTAAMVAAGAQ